MRPLSELDWQLDLRRPGDWSKPIQWLLIGILCASLLAVAYFLFIQKQQQQLQQLAQQEHSLRATFETQQSRAANLLHYRTQLSTMQSAFHALLRQLPDQAEVADLLIDVSQAGLTSGLEFALFQPETEIKRDFYAELPIKLRMSGRYHQFGGFVSNLAALPRIVTLHDITIQAQQTNNPSGDLLIMQATAKTYRYLDDGINQ